MSSSNERARRWVAGGMIFTAWGNTCFYFFGNLATNRGLSMGDNRLGEGDLFGVLAFAPALLAAFVVIILGGLGNLLGGLAGALLLAVIEVYGVALTSTAMRSILIYGVFIGVLVWRPRGLFGVRGVAR